MAPVGARTTIGAGAVVVHPVEDGVVAVGNPARAIKGRLGSLRGVNSEP
jgi:serine acetyltransferase